VNKFEWSLFNSGYYSVSNKSSVKKKLMIVVGEVHLVTVLS